MRHPDVSIYFKPHTLPRTSALSSVRVVNQLTEHQLIEDAIGESAAPFGLSSNKPRYPTIIIQNDSDEVAAESAKHFAPPPPISSERKQESLNISMIPKQVDRHAPRVTADKRIAKSLREHSRHHLA